MDLVYLDPPFKSNQDYNVLFAEKDGSGSAAQIKSEETGQVGEVRKGTNDETGNAPLDQNHDDTSTAVALSAGLAQAALRWNNGDEFAKPGRECVTGDMAVVTGTLSDLEMIGRMFGTNDQVAIQKMQQQGRLVRPKAGLPMVIEWRHEDFVRVRPKGMTDTIWMRARDLDCPEAEAKTVRQRPQRGREHIRGVRVREGKLLRQMIRHDHTHHHIMAHDVEDLCCGNRGGGVAGVGVYGDPSRRKTLTNCWTWISRSKCRTSAMTCGSPTGSHY